MIASNTFEAGVKACTQSLESTARDCDIRAADLVNISLRTRSQQEHLDNLRSKAAVLRAQIALLSLLER